MNVFVNEYLYCKFVILHTKDYFQMIEMARIKYHQFPIVYNITNKMCLVKSGIESHSLKQSQDTCSKLLVVNNVIYNICSVTSNLLS